MIRLSNGILHQVFVHAGTGSLTDQLLAVSKKVVAIEADPRLQKYLAEKYQKVSPSVDSDMYLDTNVAVWRSKRQCWKHCLLKLVALLVHCGTKSLDKHLKRASR